MKKRKGFTLIELMIVIAIIIILAAIAIPNYLRMTDRARKARVAGDFASTATALEAYMVDWGHYPYGTVEPFGKKTDGTATPPVITSHIALELTGQGTDSPEENILTKRSLLGENGGIEYISPTTIQSMYNPFIPANDYYYASVSATDGTYWVLAVQLTNPAANILWRSNVTTDITEVAGTASTVVISAAGVVSSTAVGP